MAKTTISDLAIVPEVFLEYVEKLIMQKSAMFRSGLIVNNPTFIPSKGSVVNAPSYLGFTGADEVLSDSASLTVNKVDSVNAVAAINFRGKAFGANDLVGQLAGVDPLGSLANKFADYWVRQYDTTLIQTVMGSATGLDTAYGAGTVINDQSGVAISADMVIDTLALMGEYSDELGLVIMHSAVLAKLQKNDLTKDILVDSGSNTITTYMGRQVIVDDKLVPNTGVYDTIFAAAGAVSYSQGVDAALAIETDRDILAGDDITTTRSRFIMHPGGSSWIGSAAGVSPTNAEIATGTNWAAEDATEDKRYKVRVLKHLV